MAESYVPLSDDVWEIENAFYLRSDSTRISKLLAQYEIYKMIVGLPGAVVECGVFKGASFSRFAAFRRSLETEDSRELVGFDAFGAFPMSGVAADADRAFIEQFEAKAGRGIAACDLDGLLRAKGHQNFTLVPGDLAVTINEFLLTRPELRIALLHLDLDVYEPTRVGIDALASRMVPGGIVVFDDYNAVEGATRAADEFCAQRGLQIRKLPFYNVPAFVVVNSPS